jgi:hypothetical protein
VSVDERMTSRLGGVGLRPAMVLVSAFVAPGAYAVAARAATTLEGFPSLAVTLLVVASALVGSMLAGDSPSLSVKQLLGRGTALVLVAIAVRLTVPSPSRAVSEISEGAAGLMATPFARVLLLLIVAHAVGHAVTARVALFADGPRTRHTDRAGEQDMVGMWLASVAVNVVLVGWGSAAAGVTGAALAIVAALTSAGVLAHVRATTPHPGGRRPSVVIASTRVRRGAVIGALVVAVVATVGVVALLPPAVTEASPRLIAWLSQIDFDPERPRWTPPEGGERITEPGDTGVTFSEEEPGDPRPEFGEPTTWPIALLTAALTAVLVVYLLRGGRWWHVWRTIWAWLRLRPGRAQATDEGFDDAVPLARETTSTSSWYERLERFRPRPRDPRGAILYDYLRAERALSRHELGRDGWETPLEHAERVGVGNEHRELAGLASAARYGRAAPPDEAAERSRDLARAVTRSVRDR